MIFCGKALYVLLLSAILELSRVMDTLTQVLRSSGVDLSQTRISVKINVANRKDSGLTSMASSSKVFLESTKYLNCLILALLAPTIYFTAISGIEIQDIDRSLTLSC